MSLLRTTASSCECCGPPGGGSATASWHQSSQQPHLCCENVVPHLGVAGVVRQQAPRGRRYVQLPRHALLGQLQELALAVLPRLLLPSLQTDNQDEMTPCASSTEDAICASSSTTNSLRCWCCPEVCQWTSSRLALYAGHAGAIVGSERQLPLPHTVQGLSVLLVRLGAAIVRPAQSCGTRPRPPGPPGGSECRATAGGALQAPHTVVETAQRLRKGANHAGHCNFRRNTLEAALQMLVRCVESRTRRAMSWRTQAVC